MNVNSERIFISPLAKKLANDKNIDISTIQGSGKWKNYKI